jgi:precorrin isomerase
MDYIKSGAEIYEKSFAIIRCEAELSRLPPSLEKTAVRMIHSCGMVDIVKDMDFSDDVAVAARAALEGGAPILCDAHMIASGITRARLPAQNDVICTLRDEQVPELAKKLGTTRSAAALELWKPYIEGAVLAIGNAPTALFRLLELLDMGWPKPAAIIGLPVGFVGAAESKAELAKNPRGAAFFTLHGRRGGSAMSVAAVNAMADERE